MPASAPALLPPLPVQPGGLVIFSPTCWRWIGQAFDAIHSDHELTLRILATLTHSLESLMATVAELQVLLDANTDATNALTAAVTAAAAAATSEISDLATAIGAIVPGEAVTQAQLDQLTANTGAALAAVAVLNTTSGSLAADDAPIP